jgi:ribosomal protein L11 methyltransferase
LPYRIDTDAPGAPEILIDLGALDVEQTDRSACAIMPDIVTPADVARALGGACVAVSSAAPRDDGSVWLLHPRPVRIGSILIAPAHALAAPDTLRLSDSAEAFGSGHHPSTALCVEVLEEVMTAGSPPTTMLDVGTGSGILALSALVLGVAHATGIDIDERALAAAADNAVRNGFEARLRLVKGGPESIEGIWPLITANILTSPLLEMAPVLVRRLASRGLLILSGIRDSLESDVRQTYRDLGLYHRETRTQGGWTMLVMQASW